jgi:hypothetical protein
MRKTMTTATAAGRASSQTLMGALFVGLATTVCCQKAHACLVATDAGTDGCPCNVQPGGGLLAACLYP